MAMTENERELLLTLSRVLRVVIAGDRLHRQHMIEINEVTSDVEFEAGRIERPIRPGRRRSAGVS